MVVHGAASIWFSFLHFTLNPSELITLPKACGRDEFHVGASVTSDFYVDGC